MAVMTTRLPSTHRVERASASNTLSYAAGDSPWNTWVSGSVDSESGAGSFNSLAFSDNGQPAIAYSVGIKRIKYAVASGPAWYTQEVAEGNGWITLAFAPSGRPAMSYTQSRASFSDSFVIYAVLRSGGGWVQETIAPGDNSWLAFTPSGDPAISYHDRIGEELKYAVFVDRAWTHFTVDQTGKNPAGDFTGPFTLTSLAISPAGQPAISYYDRSNGTIKCAIGTVTQTATSGLFAFLRDLLMLRWFH